MIFIAKLLSLAIDIFVFIIIIQVIVSWLVAFDIINAENRQAQNLMQLLRRITDPVYKPLRKYIPPIGGLDITPLIIIFGLSILKEIIWTIAV